MLVTLTKLLVWPNIRALFARYARISVCSGESVGSAANSSPGALNWNCTSTGVVAPVLSRRFDATPLPKVAGTMLFH